MIAMKIETNVKKNPFPPLIFLGESYLVTYAVFSEFYHVCY